MGVKYIYLWSKGVPNYFGAQVSIYDIAIGPFEVRRSEYDLWGAYSVLPKLYM